MRGSAGRGLAGLRGAHGAHWQRKAVAHNHGGLGGPLHQLGATAGAEAAGAGSSKAAQAKHNDLCGRGGRGGKKVEQGRWGRRG